MRPRLLRQRQVAHEVCRGRFETRMFAREQNTKVVNSVCSSQRKRPCGSSCRWCFAPSGAGERPCERAKLSSRSRRTSGGSLPRRKARPIRRDGAENGKNGRECASSRTESRAGCGSNGGVEATLAMNLLDRRPGQLPVPTYAEFRSRWLLVHWRFRIEKQCSHIFHLLFGQKSVIAEARHHRTGHHRH